MTSLQSITIKIAKHTTRAQQQRQLNRALLYLSKHGKHIGSLILFGQQDNAAILRQLPPILQPTSLQLEGCCLQLQPSRSIWYSRNFRGVLGAAAGVAARKQLRISNCSVVDGSTGLAAAVAELPAGLEQLGLNSVSFKDAGSACFPTAALQQLQQLTYLELVGVRFQSPDPEAQALEPLQALTRLGDVHIHPAFGEGESVLTHSICASMLSGTRHLTCLWLSHCSVEPDALVDKLQLQQLGLQVPCILVGGAAGVTQLLSCLQPLQHLTYLDLFTSLQAEEAATPYQRQPSQP